MKNLSTVDKYLKKAIELHKVHTKKIEDLEEQLHEIKVEIDEFQLQSCSIDISNDQYDKYLSLKAEAQKQFAQENLSVPTLQRQYDKSALKDITSKYQNIVKKIEEMQSNIKSTEIDEAKLNKEINQLHIDIEDTIKSIQDLNEKLNEFDISHQESNQHCKNVEIIDALQVKIRGVIGRLVQLCRVTEQKYEMAITKILGQKIDGIVVDTTNTAQKCIQFLKEYCISDRYSVIETFFPLDNLKTKTLDKNLLYHINREPHTKLAIDVMDVNSCHIDNVLKSFIGDVVICETDDQAGSLSNLLKINCVSLDGTYYKKDGTFTGGFSDLKKKAKKWSEEEYERVERERQEKNESLKRLQQFLRDKENLKENLLIKLSKWRYCLKEYLQPTQKDHEKKLKEIEDNLEQLKLKLENLESSNLVNEWQKSLFSMEQELSAIKAREDEIEDKVFTSFCKKYGLKNIRQYEANDVRKYEERYKYQVALENHSGEINNQINYEKSRNTKEMIKRYKNKKDELEKEYNELLHKRRTWDNRKNERNKYYESKAKMKSLRCEIDEIGKKLRNEERKLSAANKDLKALEKTVAVYTLKINQLWRLEIHQILTKCKIKGIKIPLQKGTIEEVLMQSRMDVESENSEQQTESESGIQEKDVEFDFSGLDESIKNLDEDQLNQHIEYLENRYKEFEEKLESRAPLNRNIKQDFKLLENKIKNSVNELSAKREQYQTIKIQFDDVKAKRGKLFIEFFNSVEKEIDQIFKRLYKDSAAQAFISMTNPEVPYLDNIEFNCLIPKKKFTKVENLSGGERTMCALALFLAIYSAKPAPCIIFDEVDVALDNDNMENIVSFIKEWKEARKTQIIIISHNERFLRCADAVIGINKSIRENSSYAVHVDLAQYLQLDHEAQRNLLTSRSTHESY
ncbi:structural maintenance of chromosomes protein 1A-like [Phymastichus coffea]|uniref:structural maintenance of chromosomes protein 1A-like n=1 Tax=Phymastichus coffea TaxID=108790 RepID=UPI00273AB1C2|nr:structural maintenance of chromosomes protein 1A-like [Phymastichus coffea]